MKINVINLKASDVAAHTNIINYRRLQPEWNLKDYWTMLKREIRVGGELLKGLLMSLLLDRLS